MAFCCAIMVALYMGLQRVMGKASFLANVMLPKEQYALLGSTEQGIMVMSEGL